MEHSNENSPPQAEKSLDFVKCFGEFANGIYKTCYCNFLNLAIIVVVLSIVQFILSLHFGSNNYRRALKTL